MVEPRCGDTADERTSSTLVRGGCEDQLPELRQVWSSTFGDPRVCIAVLDGPAELAHPAFDGALVRQVDVSGGAKPARGAGLRHGTHVASLIFGQHDGPVQGVAPKCRGVVIPIYGEQDDGSLVPCSQMDLARALSLAVAVGANVINISAGVYDETGQPEPPLARAIRLCEDQGILIVAAAGNEGCACPHVPAASPTVLAVGAADGTGNPLGFSNWSDLYRGHGVLAPGDALAGAAPGGQTQRASGTSMAAALVSGVAGLLASWQLRLGRNIDVRAIKTAILTGAVRCEETAATDCQRALGGRLDASTAFALISQGEASAMSNSNLPQTPVNSPCAQGLAGESGPADGGGRGDATAATFAGDNLPVRGTTVPLPSFFETERRLVYALGQISFDFGTEARRDAFEQAGGKAVTTELKALLAFLQDKPWEATAVTWTLQQEATPIYALQPVGPFGRETYERIRDLLKSQLEEGVTEVSIPAVLGPPIMLLNGYQVPVIFPEIRGMFGWSTPKLVQEVLGTRPQEPEKQEEYDRIQEDIENFLERLYYELSNLGVAPQDRAVNYAATNLYQVASVYKEAIKNNLKLDTITKERSQICRPNSDCWDVILTLFDPRHRYERARDVYRLTVDVSEIIPVTVGKLRRWSVY
jgi:hypothetical protein